MRKSLKRQLVNAVTILIALLWAFPILYMLLSSFKTETQVILPTFVFSPTLENYRAVINDIFYLHLKNSVIVTISTVLISAVLAISAAYALVYTPLKNPNKIYFWFVSTTFLPAVGVILPVYLAYKAVGLVDTRLALILLYTGAGVPLMIWMITNFFKDIPMEIIEAATLDGASRWSTFYHVMLPLIKNGLVSAALIVFIITWNEFFFAVTITYTEASTLPVYMSRYMTQEGFFWGKMCAISTIVVIIPVFMGFFTQKAFVRGLTSGSVKG